MPEVTLTHDNDAYMHGSSHRDDGVAVAGHEGVEEGVALDEDVGLDEVDGLDVVADDARQRRLADLVELLLAEGGGRDVVLVPVAVARLVVEHLAADQAGEGGPHHRALARHLGQPARVQINILDGLGRGDTRIRSIRNELRWRKRHKLLSTVWIAYQAIVVASVLSVPRYLTINQLYIRSKLPLGNRNHLNIAL